MKSSPYLLFGWIAFVLFSIVHTRAADMSAQINVKAVYGNVFCTAGSVSNLLSAGAILKPGIIIKTSHESTADLILPNSGTVLRLLPDTTLEFVKLDKQQAGEQNISQTSLKLVSGSFIGSQRKLATPSHFYVSMSGSVATIVGTEYVVNANGAVTVLSGDVSVNYNLPGNKGSIKIDVPAGSTFDPSTGHVVPTSPQYLQNIIADVNTVKQNAQTFKTAGATIVVKPETFMSPVHGNNGVGNGQDPQPPGNPPVNDGPGSGPGNPGNKKP